MRVLFPVFPVFLLLAACDGDGKEEADVDGDGVEAPADCNDNDASVKPGAVELCDGIDNDCDGDVDEGTGELYYVDSDGDGYGNDLVAQVALCSAEPGYVVDPGDCDDTDAGINPEAAETCDDVDRNCDGSATAGASDLLTWYIDLDADGYGASAANGGLEPVESCESPGPNYVDNDLDCNDSADFANPDGEEICNGIDDDCDGTTDNDASDAVYLFADTDNDGFGDINAPQFGCPAVGLVDNEDDCDDTDDSINPSALDACDGGIDNDCDPTTNEDDLYGRVWYVDNDGDGRGTTEIVACDQPPATATLDGDCDDTDDTVYPGAAEDCDPVDRDCDGDPEAGAVDAEFYYLDADLDGYGDVTGIDSCTVLTGFVDISGDCDDGNADISPGAPERCNLGIDDDCNPATDDDDSPTAPTWYFDGDGDGFAGLTTQTQACLEPPDSFVAADDCDDLDAQIFPGAPEVCDGGIDNDCDPGTDEELVNQLFEDADYDGYGNNDVAELGCTPSGTLINAIPEGDDCDDTDPLVNPIDTPDCTVEHCGQLAGSENWTANVEHRVTCDVLVQGSNSPTLTVEEGARVQFDPGTALIVGDAAPGALVIDADIPIEFTSAEPIPANGDWDGLTIGDNQDGSAIRGLVVEYAGGNGEAGIALDLGTSDIEISETTSRRNAADGIRVISGEPWIHDSVLIDNDRNGLYVEANQGLERLATIGVPSFTGNVVVGNGDYPITIPGSHADEIGPTGASPDNVLQDIGNPNGIDSIELLSGTMRTTGRWRQHGLPYYVAPDQIITVEDGPTAVLSIDDGVTVFFDENAELVIGDNAQGALYVGNYPNASAPGDEVQFLADPDLIVSNLNWDGVHIGRNGSDSEIAGLIVQGGGANSKGNLWIQDSAPSIAYSVFQFSDNAGIYVEGSNAAPRITDSDMLTNDTYGLFVASSSGIFREVGGASFVNNSFVGNGTTSAVLPPNFVGELDASSTFVDPDPSKRIGIHGGLVTDDATWQKLDADYEMLGTVVIEGPRDPELEIEPQASVYMARDIAFEAGTDEDGALIIEAGPNPADRVTFISADVAPGPGDWVGLVIGDNGPLRRQSVLDGLNIVHAGSLGSISSGAIRLQARDGGCPSYFVQQREVQISNVDILESGSIGVQFQPGSQASFDTVNVPVPLDNLCIVQTENPSCLPPELTSATNFTCPGVNLGYMTVESLPAIDPAVDYGFVILEAGSYETDVTIPALASSYLFLSDMIVGGPTNPTLFIEDGASLYFNTEAGLEVGTRDLGTLVMPGTSTQLLPYDGLRWDGVTLGRDCAATIQGGFVDSGGGNGAGAIHIEDCDNGSIGDVQFANSFGGCDIAYDLPLSPTFDISGAVSAATCAIP